MNQRAEQPLRRSVEKERPFAYEILSAPEARERLKRRMVELTDQIHDRDINALVFLDKSARPLSWMFSELWAARFSGEARPEIRFLNLGTASHEHVGATDRLIGTHAETNWHVRDRVNRTIEGLDIEEDWLDIDHVPAAWQERVVEHVPELERLETTFKKSFDGRRVLIVDEIVASGRSLLTALGVLSAAFPRGTFFGTALYHSFQMGREMDRRMIPWLAIPGMSGILESPESDLVSTRVTDEAVERTRRQLRSRMDEEMRVPLRWLERMPFAHDALVRALEGMRSKIDPEAFERFSAETAALRDLARAVAEQETPEGFPRSEYLKAHRDWIADAREIERQVGSTDALAFERARSDFDATIPTNYFQFSTACELWRLLGPDGYSSTEALLVRARKLREELMRLARETSGSKH